MPTERDQPPAADELEVSVFGPGVGESIVVHLGDRQWIVVDSCRSTTSEAPAPLEYLQNLHVDVATAVLLVAVTHPHDDHIEGISEVFRKAKGATLCLSIAATTEQFIQLVRLLKNSLGSSTGVDEFAALYNELVLRRPSGVRPAAAAPQYAMAGRPILRMANGAEVTALSPSDAAVALSQVAIGEQLEAAMGADVGRRLVAQSPNEAAVVLHVHAGAFDILLGSDLEESANPRDGWQAIVADHRNAGRGRIHLLKVPHHGSENAHSNDVWTHMLVPNTPAALTPFRRQKLPRDHDIARLRTLTPDVYVTADPVARKPPRRDAAIERTLREVTKSRSIARGVAGQVRFRAPLAGGPFDVSLFDGAFKVA